MKRPSLLLPLLVVSAAAPLPAQVRIHSVAPAFDRIQEQRVPVTLSLSVDEVPEASGVWVFGTFALTDGSVRDARWAEDGHGALAAGTGTGALEIIPAGGAAFVPGVILDPAGPGRWTVDLVWDLSASGVEVPAEGFDLTLHSVEMVRVPGGPFEFGQPTGVEANSVFRGPEGGSFRVDSQGPIPVGDDGLDYEPGEYGGGGAGPIPAS
jgi:hypothetical protein